MNRKVFLTLGLMMTLVLSGCAPTSSDSTGGSSTSDSSSVEPTPTEYAISVKAVDGATVTVADSAEAGETVNVSVAVTDNSRYCSGILLSSGGDVATVTMGSEYSFVMPSENVSLRAILDQRTSYGVMANVKGAIDGFAISTDRTRYYEGDTVTVNITNTSTTFEYSRIDTVGLEGTLTEVTAGRQYTFTMPANDVYLTLEVSAIPTYGLTVNVGEGGTASADKSAYYEGENMTITLAADTHYEIESVTYNGETVDPSTYATGTLVLVAAAQENVVNVSFNRVSVAVREVIVHDPFSFVSSYSGVEAGQVVALGSGLTITINTESTDSQLASWMHVQIGNQIGNLVASETTVETGMQYTVTFASINETEDFNVYIYCNYALYINSPTTADTTEDYIYIKYTNTELDMLGYVGPDTPYLLKGAGYSMLGFLTIFEDPIDVTSITYKLNDGEWSSNIASSFYSYAGVHYLSLGSAVNSGDTLEVNIVLEDVGYSELTVLGSHVTNALEVSGSKFMVGSSVGGYGNYLYLNVEDGYFYSNTNPVEVYNTDTHELVDLSVYASWSSSDKRLSISYTAPAYNITIYVPTFENPTVTLNQGAGVASVVARSGGSDTSTVIDLSSPVSASTSFYIWVTLNEGYLLDADSITVYGDDARYYRNTGTYSNYTGQVYVGTGNVTLNINPVRGVIVSAGTSTNGSITLNTTTFLSGATCNFTPVPADGYYFDGLYSDAALTQEITTTNNSFTVPSSDITIYGKFSAYETTSVTVVLGDSITADIKSTITNFSVYGNVSDANIDGLSETLTGTGFYIGESLRVNFYTSNTTHYFNISYLNDKGETVSVGGTNGKSDSPAYKYIPISSADMVITLNAEVRTVHSVTVNGPTDMEGFTWDYCDYRGTVIEGATGVADGNSLYIKFVSPGTGYKYVIDSATVNGVALTQYGYSFSTSTNIFGISSYVYGDVVVNVSRVEVQQTTLLVTVDFDYYSGYTSFYIPSTYTTVYDGDVFETADVRISSMYFDDDNYDSIVFDLYIKAIDADGTVTTIGTYTNLTQTPYSPYIVIDSADIGNKTLWIAVVVAGSEEPTTPPSTEVDYSAIAGTYTWSDYTLIINSDGTATVNGTAVTLSYDGSEIGFTISSGGSDFEMTLTQASDGGLSGTFMQDFEGPFDCSWTKSAS